jgi:UDP-N-acetylmuramyl-tripeptide synthetase
MTIIGITGTSGKTTTCYLIESILRAAGLNPGVIGTVNFRYGDQIFDNPVTTPESLDLQRILHDMHAAGVTHVVMEISSHALDLSRVHACDVDVAVFTNLSQDHLDFHQDMEQYWQSKRALFTRYLPAGGGKTTVRAVINRDDPRGGELAGQLQLTHWTTSQSGPADIQALSAQCGLKGIEALVHTAKGDLQLRSALVGHHNLENILNAVGVALALDLAPGAIQAGIQRLDNVPGRLERVADPTGQRFVYVDYAHKPDALEKVLNALRSLTRQRIICILGCGGDRDRSKRPLMGAIAARISDLVVVTSDNPRTELPEQIVAQIVEGVRQEGLRYYQPSALPDDFDQKGYVIEVDRRKAIALGIRASGPGDIILIAGKGHEPYQIIGKEKRPFDDRIEAQAALNAVNH